MFDIIKDLAGGWQAKLIIAGVVAAIVGGLYFYINHQNTVIDNQKKTIVKQEVVNEINKDTIVKKEEVTKVNEEVNITVKKEELKLDRNLSDVKQVKEQKIRVIKEQFKDKPKTIANTEEEDNLTSAVYIDSLWDTFCTGMPDSPNCIKPIPKTS